MFFNFMSTYLLRTYFYSNIYVYFSVSTLRKSLMAETEVTFKLDVYGDIDSEEDEGENIPRSNSIRRPSIHSGTRLTETTIITTPVSSKTSYGKITRKEHTAAKTKNHKSRKRHNLTTTQRQSAESENTSTESEDQSSNSGVEKIRNLTSKERRIEMLNYLKQRSIAEIYNSTKW